MKPGMKTDEKRHARNEAMKEHDHAALREAIIAVVRETELKVLLCPEDMTQMAVGKEMLCDKLPDDVRQRVVWRENFWLTDEALSTYVRSAGLFGIGDAFAHHVHRQRRPGHRLPLGQSRRARASCGATSASATGSSISIRRRK